MTKEPKVENEIVKQDNSALVQYGNQNEIEALGKRIRVLMPGGSAYTVNEAILLAQLCISWNLNPFNGEAWLIKHSKTGEVLGAIPGIKGLRKMAKRQADYWGVGDNGGFEQITSEAEMTKLEAKPGDIVYKYTLGDAITQKRWIEGCVALRDVGIDQDSVREMMGPQPTTIGVGIWKKGEASKMDPHQVAMFRGEKDALKRRFNVNFFMPLSQITETEMLSRDPEHAGMTAAEYEEVMGRGETDERDRLPPTSHDKPEGNMMGFDVTNGSVEVLDLEFEDDSELPSEPSPEVPTPESVKKTADVVQEQSYFSQDIKADGTPREPEPETESEPKAESKLPPNPINKNRPYSPKKLYDAVEKWADLFPNKCKTEHRDYLNKVLVTMFDGDTDKVERVCEHLTGQPDTLSMEDGYVQALLQGWMEISDWKGVPSNVSIIEGKALINSLGTSKEDPAL